MEAADKTEVPDTKLPKLTDWPGAFGIYKYSSQAVKLNLGTLVLLFVADAVVTSIINALFRRTAPELGVLINFAVSALFTSMLTYLLLAGTHGKKPTLQQSFEVGQQFIVRTFLLSLLTGLAVFGSFLLFIIPGFFVLPRLMLAEYFLIDQNLSVMDAFKASWNQTRGHAAKVWGIIGVIILMVLPAITIIGIVLTVYWLVMFAAAYALLYGYIKTQKPAATA